MQIRLFLFSLLLSAALTPARAQQKETYAIGFYNLENLFDTCHDAGKNDYEYLPEGRNKWTAEKYAHKLQRLSRVLSEMATDELPGVGCAAIGVAEVENARCLTDLCNQPALKSRRMQFAHVEGPDQRGIDCALLYNPALFSVRNTKLVPYVYRLPEDSARATRGFFVVSGMLADEHVTIIVNHLPARFSGSYYREEGGRQLRAVKDSLLRDDPEVKLLIMGDMNDDPKDSSMAVCLGARRAMSEVGDSDLYNPWWDIHATGTLMYKGAWNLFDQIILSPSLLRRSCCESAPTLKFREARIFRRDYLIQQDGDFKGSPLRTFSRGVWLDGYSDHLPTLIYIEKETCP